MLKKLPDERLKIYIDLMKWVVGSIAVAVTTLIIDWGLRKRDADQKEIQLYSQYKDIITDEHDLYKRKELARFFKVIGPSEDFRNRWSSYYLELDTLYNATLRKADETLKKSAETDDSKLKEIYRNRAVEYVNEVSPEKTVTISKEQMALLYEQLGYQALLEQQKTKAQQYFSIAESYKPQLHNNRELVNYLNNIKSDKFTKEMWKPIYRTILKKYSWGMDAGYKEKFEEAAR